MPQLSVPNRPIEGPSAWVRTDLRPEDWRVELSTACLDEIRQRGRRIAGLPAADDRARRG